MDTLEVRILQRYFRKTIAHPEGSVCHHGDCDFFNIKICTCGLLHDLRVDLEKAAELYPLIDIELGENDRAREASMNGRKTRRSVKK